MHQSRQNRISLIATRPTQFGLPPPVGDIATTEHDIRVKKSINHAILAFHAVSYKPITSQPAPFTTKRTIELGGACFGATREEEGMGKLTDIQMRNRIKPGERFDMRDDGDGLYLIKNSLFARIYTRIHVFL